MSEQRARFRHAQLFGIDSPPVLTVTEQQVADRQRNRDSWIPVELSLWPCTGWGALRHRIVLGRLEAIYTGGFGGINACHQDDRLAIRTTDRLEAKHRFKALLLPLGQEKGNVGLDQPPSSFFFSLPCGAFCGAWRATAFWRC